MDKKRPKFEVQMSNSTKKVLEEIAPKIEWGNPLCKLAEVGQQSCRRPKLLVWVSKKVLVSKF